MPSVFLDTAGWFAAQASRDAGHAKARKAYVAAATAGHRIVTTTLVIAETHALILRRLDGATGRRFLQHALDSGTTVVVEVDAALLSAAAARWIDRFDDQQFSLCDAVSFEVMRRERITRALTFDKHFATAGFEIL